MATPMDAKTLAHVTQFLVQARRQENVRFSEIYEYFKNRVIDIYIPKRATEEFKKLVDQSRWNILPTLENTLANKLFVDGYRPDRQAENAEIWDQIWQPNRMDARQAGLWHNGLRYGMSYAIVLPGKMGDREIPVITPRSPRRVTALYQDPINDEWPMYVLEVGTPYPEFTAEGAKMVTPIAVYDANHRYRFNLPSTQLVLPVFGQGSNVATPLLETVTVDAANVTTEEHGLGITPVVRFMESMGDLDDGPEGILFPMLSAQRGLNQTTFNLKMAEQYAAFKQRYVTGMAIDEDEDGNAINPFNAAVDQMFQAESVDSKFGEFGQTDLSGYLDSRDKQLLYITSSRQMPPQTMVVGNTISNVNAEALAMLMSEHGQDVNAHKTAFGEGVEQLARLGGKAMGDQAAWEDTSAQVRWRDTTPRSLAQVADALGKLADQLGIPRQALWERIPDVTDQDLERWKEMAEEEDTFAKLNGLSLDGMVNGNAVPAGTSADPAAPARDVATRRRNRQASLAASSAG